MRYIILRQRTITKDQLVKHVWSDVVVGAKTLDVHIFNIRKKVAPLNLEIKYFPQIHIQWMRRLYNYSL